MRLLMSFFILVVFSLGARAEVPPANASLKECYAENNPSDKWRTYFWERKDARGPSHIYFLKENGFLIFEYIADGHCTRQKSLSS